MQAQDIMTTEVATVQSVTPVREVASLLLKRRVSAVPVVDDDGGLLGIVSECDLMRRPETGTERHSSWWLSLLTAPEDRAASYIKTHGGQAGDVMTRNLITITEDTSLGEAANTLERHRIKRVPVLRDGKMVGILSRADLLRGLVAWRPTPTTSMEDRTIKEAAIKALAEAGVSTAFMSVIVSDGVIYLWGAVESELEKEAARVAVDSAPGVVGVREEIAVLPPGVRNFMGSE